MDIPKAIIGEKYPCCENCPYWIRTAETLSTAQKDEGKGQCRRGPPVILALGGNPKNPHFGSAWPITGNNLYCGEHPRFQRSIVR